MVVLLASGGVIAGTALSRGVENVLGESLVAAGAARDVLL
jgi:hypothetical protein